METNRPPTLTGLRILVVEDLMVVAQEIEALLRTHHWQVVGPVSSLNQAVEAARSQPLDGALLDVNLDGEEVYPVVDELLSRGVPFVFMTGYDCHQLPPEFQMFPCLEKPFSMKELAAVVKREFAERHTIVRSPDQVGATAELLMGKRPSC